jgi:hypothetical protein
MTDQPIPAKVCPLFVMTPEGPSTYCLGEECAWYNAQGQCCGILMLGRGPASRDKEARPLAQPPAPSEMRTPSPPPQPAHPEKPRMCQDCRHYSGPRWEGDMAYCWRHRHPLPARPLVGCEAWEPRQE